MSGHSKWATIKRKKGAMDAKRGQLFTRLTREIVMAAREGGGDPETNFRLRLAVEKARSQNMPKENIERAIKRGTGESKEGNVFEQVFYEGYAPHGVALMIECYTENRNRTVAEVRHVLSRAGGNLGEAGSVSWQFKRMAYFALSASKIDFDKVFEVAVENGAEDVTQDGDTIEVLAPVENFKVLSDAFRNAKMELEEAELRMIPTNEVELGVEETLQVLRTIDAIEELDDVQNVYHTMKISEAALAALENEA
ncbi:MULTISPECIES: YebC/PmpR family DNA-binding transcriptional regulator [Anaerolinea]|uniref:YebC/PmpR family DNA-binding transcriptional regulator n=1 Tax=Anaerolinea TaxID=233189 RepID=UPI002604A797|nr:YebC/PmpR family DNA-binding transcriptional regulator [Anaerolinea thermophila]